MVGAGTQQLTEMFWNYQLLTHAQKLSNVTVSKGVGEIVSFKLDLLSDESYTAMFVTKSRKIKEEIARWCTLSNN